MTGLESPSEYIDTIASLFKEFTYEVQLAHAYHLIRRYDTLDTTQQTEFVTILSNVIELNKERPEAYYMLIDHFRKLGEHEEALQFAEKAFKHGKAYSSYSER